MRFSAAVAIHGCNRLVTPVCAYCTLWHQTIPELCVQLSLSACVAVLKMLVAGFWPTETTHGCDSVVGVILREMRVAEEHNDYAHVVSLCRGFVTTELVSLQEESARTLVVLVVDG